MTLCMLHSTRLSIPNSLCRPLGQFYSVHMWITYYPKVCHDAPVTRYLCITPHLHIQHLDQFTLMIRLSPYMSTAKGSLQWLAVLVALPTEHTHQCARTCSPDLQPVLQADNTAPQCRFKKLWCNVHERHFSYHHCCMLYEKQLYTIQI